VLHTKELRFFVTVYKLMADERIKKQILQCESQDRQCTYNVTLRRVRATIVAAEEQ